MKKILFACLLTALMGVGFVGCGDTKRLYVTAEGDSSNLLELTINLPFNGNLTPSDVDTFTVVLEKGVTYKLVLSNTSNTDTLVVQVCDPDGNLLAESSNGVLEFTPTEGGLYVIKVSGNVFVTTNYSFTVVLEVKDGKDGADGKDGTDGEDGADGQNGADGQDGKDGEDGADGRDGIAAIISPGTFLLCNHRDGAIRPPCYGLRLDELFDKTEGHDRFTFDFNAEGCRMVLEYDGVGIRIHGTAFGGLDIGGRYDPECSGKVAIDFTYPVVQVAFADDDLVVVSPMTGTGTLTWKPGTEEERVIPLFEKANRRGLIFRLGNESDDDGHRRHNGVSGWGWLNHTVSDQHVSASDWLFILKPLPKEPEEEEGPQDPQ